MTRRQYLLGLLAGSLATRARAIDPLPRQASPKRGLSLAAYSFRQELDLAAKPRPKMTLLDFIDYAVTLSVQAVELTSYYFAKTTPEYLLTLRQACEKRGLRISGVPIRTDFCKSDAAAHQAELEHTRQWLRHAETLGAPTVRVFAGTIPRGRTRAEVLPQVQQSLKTLAPEAAARGVTLVLENHHGITGTADELLEIIRPIPGPGLALNADTGNFRTPDPYAELARILPYARTLQLKTEIFPKGGAAQPVDYDRLIRLIHQSGYDGDITLEYEAAAPPRQAIPQALAEIRRRWVCA